MSGGVKLRDDGTQTREDQRLSTVRGRGLKLPIPIFFFPILFSFPSPPPPRGLKKAAWVFPTMMTPEKNTPIDPESRMDAECFFLVFFPILPRDDNTLRERDENAKLFLTPPFFFLKKNFVGF